MSPMAQRLQQDVVKPLTPSKGFQDAPRAVRTMSDTPSMLREEERPRISNVRVLNTSLHHVHHELMQIRDKAKSRGEDPDLALHPAQSDESTVAIPEEVKDQQGNPIFRSKEEQEATSRALKPHSRSVTNMADLKAVLKPEALTPVPADDKKSSKKMRRWQFGIRSRNQPYEAMRCLYGALREIGAEWEILPVSAADTSADGEEIDPNPPPPDLEPGEQYSILQSKYSTLPSDYYIPRDAWSIRARILKKGMLMPGEAPSVSANSSAVSLPDEAKQQLKKHMEELGRYASEKVAHAFGANPTNPYAKTVADSEASRPGSGIGDHGHDAFTGPAPSLSKPESFLSLHKKPPNEHVGVWIFVDIQLYTLETNVYVVDFKCDGYQNVVWHDNKKDEDRTKSPQSHSAVASPITSRPTSGMEHTSSQSGTDDTQDAAGYWVPMTQRFHKEKEISSAYPFLDVASDLVAQLASQPQ